MNDLKGRRNMNPPEIKSLDAVVIGAGFVVAAITVLGLSAQAGGLL